jgi:hypothetical protein
MDITIYLPDELGQWAKDAGLNLSQTLRSEVEAERHRRTAVDQTLESAGVVHLRVEGRDGRTYTARLHATALHEETGDVQAYLGEDGRVYVYDERDNTLHTHDTSMDLGDWLAAYLRDDAYIQAMNALGEDAVIDIGQATG